LVDELVAHSGREVEVLHGGLYGWTH
jgi:hypothetical protein